MSLGKCKKEITYREYLDWQVRFQEEWNEPSRTDHYLMLIAHRIQYVLSKSGGKVNLKSQRLPFSFKKQGKQSQDKKTLLEWSKAAWCGALGIKQKK